MTIFYIVVFTIVIIASWQKKYQPQLQKQDF